MHAVDWESGGRMGMEAVRRLKRLAEARELALSEQDLSALAGAAEEQALKMPGGWEEGLIDHMDFLHLAMAEREKNPAWRQKQVVSRAGSAHDRHRLRSIRQLAQTFEGKYPKNWKANVARIAGVSLHDRGITARDVKDALRKKGGDKGG